MELVTVGTGTVAPSATRTSACHWVSRARLKILLDCGPGALHRLGQFGLPWPEVTHVVLSHFHPDHWAELPMLVYALKYTTVPPPQEPLVSPGPPGAVRLVYTGDTGPSPELARWAAGCDLLLAECSLPEAMAIDSHLTPLRAGELARGAGAKRLVLTHFYPPVETSDPAREAGTRFQGPVAAAKDGDRFRIGGR